MSNIPRGEHYDRNERPGLVAVLYYSQYESCLESEIQAKLTRIIGCIPLWFTDTPTQVRNFELKTPNTWTSRFLTASDM